MVGVRNLLPMGRAKMAEDHRRSAEELLQGVLLEEAEFLRQIVERVLQEISAFSLQGPPRSSVHSSCGHTRAMAAINVTTKADLSTASKTNGMSTNVAAGKLSGICQVAC